LVAQVKFTEWTSDDQLRQPVFLGLRTDRQATGIVRMDIAAIRICRHALKILKTANPFSPTFLLNQPSVSLES
jgi:hypothetical protein